MPGAIQASDVSFSIRGLWCQNNLLNDSHLNLHDESADYPLRVNSENFDEIKIHVSKGQEPWIDLGYISCDELSESFDLVDEDQVHFMLEKDSEFYATNPRIWNDNGVETISIEIQDGDYSMQSSNGYESFYRVDVDPYDNPYTIINEMQITVGPVHPETQYRGLEIYFPEFRVSLVGTAKADWWATDGATLTYRSDARLYHMYESHLFYGTAVHGWAEKGSDAMNTVSWFKGDIENNLTWNDTGPYHNFHSLWDIRGYFIDNTSEWNAPGVFWIIDLPGFNYRYRFNKKYGVWANDDGTLVLVKGLWEGLWAGCYAENFIADSDCYPYHYWAHIPDLQNPFEPVNPYQDGQGRGHSTGLVPSDVDPNKCILISDFHPEFDGLYRYDKSVGGWALEVGPYLNVIKKLSEGSTSKVPWIGCYWFGGDCFEEWLKITDLAKPQSLGDGTSSGLIDCE